MIEDRAKIYEWRNALGAGLKILSAAFLQLLLHVWV